MAGIFDLTQAFIGFEPDGVDSLSNFTGGCRRHFWAALASNGSDIRRRRWSSLPFHHRVRRGDGLLRRQQKNFVFLVQRPVLCGLIYGELVFLFIASWLFRFRPSVSANYNLATYITGPIGHPLLVGLPIALCARRFGS